MGDQRSALVVAPDKFRGTVTAGQAATAMARGAARAGRPAATMPLSDGGEGLLEVIGAVAGSAVTWESADVTGPLGAVVAAPWLQAGRVAVIESARASGLALVGGAQGNDALAASSRGTGELMMAAAGQLRSLHGGRPGAVDFDALLRRTSGADRPAGPEVAGPVGTILVGLGGSATTDGGAGMVAAIEGAGGLDGIAVIGACDVDTRFVEAALQFAGQKGATDLEVAELTLRLGAVAARFTDRFGVDVTAVPGSGAAGGMGGAIVALGGTLRSGYRLVADLTGMATVLPSTSMVVTGEGSFDASSFPDDPPPGSPPNGRWRPDGRFGKVTGSVLRDAAALGIPSLVVAGRVAGGVASRASELGAEVVSLVDRFGEARAVSETLWCIEEAVAGALDDRPGG